MLEAGFATEHQCHTVGFPRKINAWGGIIVQIIGLIDIYLGLAKACRYFKASPFSLHTKFYFSLMYKSNMNWTTQDSTKHKSSPLCRNGNDIDTEYQLTIPFMQFMPILLCIISRTNLICPLYKAHDYSQ